MVTKVEKETLTGIDVSYELIAGERRLMAAKLLGLRIVPAIIRNVKLEREKVELAVIENIQREKFEPRRDRTRIPAPSGGIPHDPA